MNPVDSCQGKRSSVAFHLGGHMSFGLTQGSHGSCVTCRLDIFRIGVAVGNWQQISEIIYIYLYQANMIKHVLKTDS